MKYQSVKDTGQIASKFTNCFMLMQMEVVWKCSIDTHTLCSASRTNVEFRVPDFRKLYRYK